MRITAVVLASLMLLGTSAAISIPLARPDPAADAIATTDELIERLGAVDDIESALAEGLRLGAIEPAEIRAIHSATLDAAILRAYAASGIAVDEALLAEIAEQSASASSPALVELFDAFADAQLASAQVLTPADRASLAKDLPMRMMLRTLKGVEIPELARADVPMAAAAAVRLAGAIPHLEDLAPAEGCGRVLDLPFFQIGAPCDDTYVAGTTNFIEIDYGGNDRYLHAAAGGIAGVGTSLHIDYGDGADVYEAASSAQAFSLGGVAILVNEAGADSYSVSTFGQGFSAAGVAILYDGGVADDLYVSPPTSDSLGTKAGSLAGVGILVDEGGSDLYQQDGLDGFVYGGGGVGLLVEQGDGDDQYVTNDNHIVLIVPVPGGEPIVEDLGNFAGPVQVSAEVAGGVAVLYEEGGDDTYFCGQHVRQGCQGAGGVGAFAALLDLAGNDVYELGLSVTPLQGDVLPVFPTGQGIAYGEGSAPPGVGVGVLRDLAGDDRYLADKYAQGYATGGLGLFLDEGAGADVYTNALAALVGVRDNGQTWADGLALGVGVDT